MADVQRTRIGGTVRFTIEMKGALARPPGVLGKQFDRNMVSAYNDVTGGSYKDIRAGIPVRHKDGLRSTVKMQPARLGQLAARVYSDSPKMVFIEKNTRAHVIVPKNARALAFKVRGAIVFTQRVNHPGTRGKHLWQRADQQIRARLWRALDAAAQAALNGVNYVRRYWRAS